MTTPHTYTNAQQNKHSARHLSLEPGRKHVLPQTELGCVARALATTNKATFFKAAGRCKAGLFRSMFDTLGPLTPWSVQARGVNLVMTTPHT